MKTRLQKLMVSEGLTSAKLAEIAGVQPSTVSHILSGRNHPSFDFIANLLTAYPSLNPRWLLLGEGDIFTTDRKSNVIQPQESVQKNMNQPDTALNSLLNKENQANPQNATQKNQSDLRNDLEPVMRNEIAEQIVMFYSDGTFSLHKKR